MMLQLWSQIRFCCPPIRFHDKSYISDKRKLSFEITGLKYFSQIKPYLFQKSLHVRKDNNMAEIQASWKRIRCFKTVQEHWYPYKIIKKFLWHFNILRLKMKLRWNWDSYYRTYSWCKNKRRSRQLNLPLTIRNKNLPWNCDQEV